MVGSSDVAKLCQSPFGLFRRVCFSLESCNGMSNVKKNTVIFVRDLKSRWMLLVMAVLYSYSFVMDFVLVTVILEKSVVYDSIRSIQF